MEVVYYRKTQFYEALAKMLRSGGVPQQAARKVREIIGALDLGEARASDVARLTKHGETRIKHCVKFDLPGRHRLICVHHANVFTLLFVGSHDECDRWLDENRGLSFIVDRRTNRISVVSEIDPSQPLPRRPVNIDVSLDSGLLDGLPADYLDRLPVRPGLLRTILGLKATVDDDELLECTKLVQDTSSQTLILNVLLALPATAGSSMTSW